MLIFSVIPSGVIVLILLAVESETNNVPSLCWIVRQKAHLNVAVGPLPSLEPNLELPAKVVTCPDKNLDYY